MSSRKGTFFGHVSSEEIPRQQAVARNKSREFDKEKTKAKTNYKNPFR